MKFELGRYYEHSGGGRIHIVALAQTRMWGTALLSESREDGVIIPCGMSKANAVNWREITANEFAEKRKKSHVGHALIKDLVKC